MPGLEWSFGDLPRSPESGQPSDAGERFELKEELGRGAMGMVVRAHDRVLGRDVALKTILGGRAGPSAMERLWREARAAGALSHPGVVRVHDCLELPAGPSVVYELLEGCRPMTALLTPEQPLARRLALFLQVAQAMAHAHDHGVVHRDLKPENVLVDAGGRARVTDFGLAWHAGADSLTASGAALGTPSYMAPELLGLVSGASRDPRVDVWSLGVMLYQSICLRLPFEAQTLGEFMAHVGRASPVPAGRVEPSLPAGVQDVCARALRLAPEERFARAGELAARLEEAMRGGGRPAGSRRVARLAAPLLLGLAGLLALKAWPGPEPATEPALAASSSSQEPLPSQPPAWSLHAGAEWTTTYGYHARETRADGGRSEYHMQYSLRLQVLSVDDRAAQLDVHVGRIRFAMREREGPAGESVPTVIDSEAEEGAELALRLPDPARFSCELLLPVGRVGRVRGAGRLKHAILQASRPGDRYVLGNVLVDLEDDVMRMDLGLLLGLCPPWPTSEPWRVEGELRPAGLYPLRISYLVSPAGADRLTVGLSRVVSADPRLTQVTLSGNARREAGRVSASRMTLQLRIEEEKRAAREVELTFLLGGERPSPLESLDRPP